MDRLIDRRMGVFLAALKILSNSLNKYAGLVERRRFGLDARHGFQAPDHSLRRATCTDPTILGN